MVPHADQLSTVALLVRVPSFLFRRLTRGLGGLTMPQLDGVGHSWQKHNVVSDLFNQ